jgi:hypothetical protein
VNLPRYCCRESKTTRNPAITHLEEVSMRSSSLRRLIGASMTTLALATAACGGDGDSTGPSDPPGPAPADVAGDYSLTQVRTLGNLGGGGSGLPVTFTDGSGSQLVFVSGTLALHDGSFDLTVETTFNGSAATLYDYGTYSANGSSIEFHSDKSTPRLSTASVSGSKVTANSQFLGIQFEIDLQK